MEIIQMMVHHENMNYCAEYNDSDSEYFRRLTSVWDYIKHGTIIVVLA